MTKTSPPPSRIAKSPPLPPLNPPTHYLYQKQHLPVSKNKTNPTHQQPPTVAYAEDSSPCRPPYAQRLSLCLASNLLLRPPPTAQIRGAPVVTK
ncbi:hypothetical protein Pcinc_032019 [Petrolisthes cinctipes]|uniref:Uncharacterized protein n=1 Tax=Petrolisthes cinctipes TaxID=88211 RepID=A0AAE1EVN2_PETCI|nr:hypothetical protein Pcinc_032019 [Petrolisthes cinctipes]